MKRQAYFALQCCFAVALVLSIVGCEKQHKTGRGASPYGVYNLVSIDGKTVPGSVSHEGEMLQIRSGVFTIKADGTCRSKMVFVGPSGTEETREVDAAYTKDDSKLSMQWKNAGQTVGIIQGNTFTMENEGMVFVYRK